MGTYLVALQKKKNPVHAIAMESTNVYDSLDEMIDEVDAIDICTPPKYHVDNLLVALKKGKHIICEKPLARNWWDVALVPELRDLASKACFQLHTQGIWNPLIKAGKELIAGGTIGEIKKIRILHQGADPKHTVNLTSLWDKFHSGGGALVDIGPHAYASMWYWLGGSWKPVSVEAKMLAATVPVRTIAGVAGTRVTVDDDAHLRITWKDAKGNEIIGELEATWNKKDWFDGKPGGSGFAPELYYEVEGTTGTMSFPNVTFSLSKPAGLVVAFKIARPGGRVELVKHPLPPKGVEDIVFFEEFADVVNGSAKSRNDFAFGEEMLKVFGAAYLSRQNDGGAVKLAEFEQHAKQVASSVLPKEKQTDAVIDDLFKGF